MEKTPHQPKSKELNFSALTDGLGFHPFSDGLPYAPVGKTSTEVRTSRSMGSGAEVAGPPSFAMPSQVKPSPQIARPTPRVSVPIAHQPFKPKPSIPASLSISAPVIPSLAIDKVEESKPAFETRPGFVYLLKRAFAYCLDTGVNLALCATSFSLALMYLNVGPEALVSPGTLLLTVVFFAFFNWSLITAQEVAFNTTLGKRVFRLALDGSASAIFLRAFFFLPSAGFCGLDVLWACIDRKKRCWHDVVVDLQPVEIAQL